MITKKKKKKVGELRRIPQKKQNSLFAANLGCLQRRMTLISSASTPCVDVDDHLISYIQEDMTFLKLKRVNSSVMATIELLPI